MPDKNARVGTKTEEFASVDLYPVFSAACFCDLDCVKHVNLNMEILVVHSGTLTVGINDTVFNVSAGEGIFIAPYESHYFSTPDKKRNRGIVICFSEADGDIFYSFLSAHLPENRIFTVPDELIRWSENYILQNRLRLSYQRKGLVMPFLAYVLDQCSFREKNDIEDDLFLSLLALIDKQYKGQISMSSLSKQLGISEKRLGMIFHKETGTCVGKYLLMRRLGFVENELRQNRRKSISEIAYSAGFRSLYTFNRCFKEYYHMTPTQYRKKAEQTRE